MKYYNIPVFVPHLGCPFDCVFCDQRKITGSGTNVDENTVKSIIESHLEFLPKKDAGIEVAFFGGSFTGIDKDLQERLLKTAYSYIENSNIIGIRVSTRPDYIDHTVMERLVKYGVTTIELGVQSMNENVLLSACRGHSSADVEAAVEIIRQYPVNLGLQMMTGLPGDTPERSLETADRLIALKPDCVRIYPTLVIKGTELYNMYKRGEYKPQTVREAVDLCSVLVKKFEEKDIKVIRVGLQNTEEISESGSVAAGPFHSAFGELVDSELYYEKISALISDTEDEKIEIAVNPSEISKAVGHKKMNTERILNSFGKKIKITADSSVEKGGLKIKGR